MCICIDTRHVFVNCCILDCFPQTAFYVVVVVAVVVVVLLIEQNETKRREIFSTKFVSQCFSSTWSFAIPGDYSHHFLFASRRNTTLHLNIFFFSVCVCLFPLYFSVCNSTSKYAVFGANANNAWDIVHKNPFFFGRECVCVYDDAGNSIQHCRVLSLHSKFKLGVKNDI